MENKSSQLEQLYDKVEQLADTSVKLYRAKTVKKSSELGALMSFAALFAVVALLFFILLNFAVSFWLGELLAQPHLGFLIVAGFYLLVLIILWFSRASIKRAIQNSIIEEAQK
jgi:fatty acid desaturase